VAAAPNESATKAPLKKICKAASSMEVTSREWDRPGPHKIPALRKIPPSKSLQNLRRTMATAYVSNLVPGVG